MKKISTFIKESEKYQNFLKYEPKKISKIELVVEYMNGQSVLSIALVVISFAFAITTFAILIQ